MTKWLITQDTDFYQPGIEELIQAYDKCALVLAGTVCDLVG